MEGWFQGALLHFKVQLMVNTGLPLERHLQASRLRKSIEYLRGDVLDFGGNEGELAQFVSGDYTLINYDHSNLLDKTYDTIIMLAVLEHIDVEEVYKIFNKFKRILRPRGTIFLTTPSRMAKPVLEFLAALGLLDGANIEEHKHYWNKTDIELLADKTGFQVIKFGFFQLGFNQMAILKHK